MTATTRYIIRAEGRHRERAYRLPSRCAQCGSRGVYAELQETYAFEHGPWVVQRCGDCDDVIRHRLLRDESDPPAWMGM